MAGTLGREVISTRQRKIAELAQREPKLTLTTLAHHVDEVWMREAYRRIRKDAAAGVDGVTAAQYEADLEANLSGLLERFKSGRYRAPAVRRVHLEKPGTSKTRPIGIPTLEDKILQRAVLMVLEPVYEQDFLECSYGFRPGRGAHQALQSLWEGLMEFGGGWARQIRSDCRCGVAGVKHAPSGFHCCPFARRATDFTVIGRSDGDGCGRAGGVLRPAGVSGGPSCAEGEWRGDGGSPQGRSGGRGPRAGVGGHLEEVEHTARISGQATHGLGDGEPARLDEADGEAA